MVDYLLQEDGVSKFTLEDGSGFLLLESLPEIVGRAIRVVWTLSRRVKWR